MQLAATQKLLQSSAGMLATAWGALITRISPWLHDTKHYPLSQHERAALVEAVTMVLEARCSALILEGGADLMLFAAITLQIAVMREGAAHQDMADAQKAKAAPNAPAEVST